MTRSFIRAVTHYATPEQFIHEFLIPSLHARKLLSPDSGEVDFEKLNRAMRVDKLFFEHGGHRIQLEMQMMHRSQDRVSARSKSEHSDPYLKLGLHSKIPLDVIEFSEAQDKFGRLVRPHSVEGSSDTHLVKLPTAMARHWPIGTTEIATLKGGSALLVKVDKRAFDALKEALKPDAFFDRYYVILDYLSGKIGKAECLAKLHFKPDELRQRDPVVAFLANHPGGHELITGLPPLRNREEIQRDLFKVFGESERIKHHARTLDLILAKTEGKRAAATLAVTLKATSGLLKPKT